MLNEHCKEIILGLGKGEPLNQAFVDIFNAVANEAAVKKIPSSTFLMPLYDENTNPQPGDYLAELHFVVRKIDETANSSDEVDEGSEEQSEI